MATPDAETLRYLDFQKIMIEQIVEAFYIPTRFLVPKPPRFRFNREISARRARKLRKRGEDCFFLRWTVSGKCRYAWGGPPCATFRRRLGPWQNPQWRPPVYTQIGHLTNFTIQVDLQL